MSFRGQKLVNTYPQAAKIRRDPSSLGRRIYDVFADWFDFQAAELVTIKDDLTLLKRALGAGHCWRVDLSSDDQFPFTVSRGGLKTYTYPSVVGDMLDLQRVTSFEALIYSPPTRLTALGSEAYASMLTYDSQTGIYNNLEEPERLTVVVSDSTHYRIKSSTRDPKASGLYYVIIQGFDVNNTRITEYINIPDDGRFETRNVFKQVTNVSTEGFNGRVRVGPSLNTNWIVDPYHLAVSEEREGSLRLAYEQTDDYPQLRYYTNIFALGQTYRQTGSEEDTFIEDIWSQTLMLQESNDGPTNYEIIDMAIDPETLLLWTLDDEGYVYVYDHKPTGFTPCSRSSELTREFYIEVQPLQPWASYNQTMKLFTWFSNPKYQIWSVIISRVSPVGDTTYLQSDMTWGAGSYTFVSENIADKLPENTWKDLQFTCLFDGLGQWEFYAEVRTAQGTTLSHTGVMVDYLDPLVVLDTEVSAPLGLYFSHDGKLKVYTTSDIHTFQIHADVYLANEQEQSILLKEEYTEVEITYV